MQKDQFANLIGFWMYICILMMAIVMVGLSIGAAAFVAVKVFTALASVWL